MSWRKSIAALMVGWGALASTGVAAQTLYAASVRSLASAGGEGVAGSLYTVNLGTGSPTYVAPIRLDGTTPIGITGLAAHPATGVIYGITSPLGETQGQSLVTLDVTTGTATRVGMMRHQGSDIAFNRAGILFTWLPGTSQLGIVDISNGAVTPIGAARGSGPPAGLAIDADNKGYVTTTGAAGTLDTVDIGNGAVTTGPALSGAPFASAINSMSFMPTGLLLAVNSNAGVPALTRLVTINIATGVVSIIGILPDDTDAIGFTPEARRDGLNTMNIQTLALLVLGTIALILGIIGWAVGRRPQP